MGNTLLLLIADVFLTLICYTLINVLVNLTMAQKQQRYLSYLLRLWQTGSKSTWRASLDSVNGERLGFASLDALLVFLREQTEIEEEVRTDSDETQLKDQGTL